ncbi:MAG: glycosyltransferase family 2 protein [Candidatus Binatia bacterium]
MNNQKLRISIGLPVYNGERFLAETLDSLLVQTYTEFELIISDNASTDRTEEICRRYAAKDQRVRYYRNSTNIGIGRNFNRVFELSTAEYFKWASADDLCKPGHLAACLSMMDSDETVVLVYPKTSFIDENGLPLDLKDPGWDLRSEAAHERLRYVLRARHWVNPHYGLIRASALANTRLMPSYPGGDYRLLAELSLRGKFVEIPDNVFFRRIHPWASSQNLTNLMWPMEFRPVDQGEMCLPFWNLSIDHLITIVNSELGIRYKLSLVGLVLKGMWWERRRLLQELKVVGKSYWSKLSPNWTIKADRKSVGK